MDLSIRWLNEYTDTTGITPRKFAEAMTMSGSKVEGYTVEGSDISGVVVGKILSIEAHPNADSLVVCSVDVGNETLQIVTGAKNLKADDVVPVATNGATVSGSKQISTAPLRGVESQGMLCSLSELGLTKNDFPYAVEDGIFVLQEDCALGQDIHSAIGYDDTIVEFEITSNRPDCLSVMGLAREAACTFKRPLYLPKPVIKRTTGSINDILSVEVKNSELCPRYVAKAVTNVKIAPSPRWMRERLRASGVRPINNIVDITNYVMLEYGQPMHAFDINTVSGGKLIIRNATDGECILTLDGIKRSLSPEMLVIADAQKPSAVAGVMGGELSGIHGDTVTVVFESANFLGSSVRTTAKKLGMRTESSSRFEKGLDPSMCLAAAERACELVELLGAGEVIGGEVDVNNTSHAPRKIRLDSDWVNRFLGISLTRLQMEDILTAIGFKVEGEEIVVPSWRADVEHKADLAEEIARFYGYNIIPSTAIRGSVYGMITRRQQLERIAVNTMLAQGLNEVCSYTFLSPKTFDKVRIPADSPLRNCVVITNPLGEDTSVMRTSVYHSIMDLLAKNYNNRNPKACLFELAKEFIPNESIDVLPQENMTLAMGFYGDDVDFYSVKGVVEALLGAFAIEDVDVSAITNNSTFHPGRCGEITKDGRHLALLGEVHPQVAKNYDIETRAYLVRMDFEALCDLANTGKQTYKPLPKFPASTRDLALICDDSLTVLSIEKAIKQACGGLLEKVELFDCYRGSQIPEGKKSLAFSLILRSADRTLSETELSETMNNVLAAVKNLGAQLRG